MPSKKKKYNARFPPARIKKMMQADEEVGKVAAVVPVMISRTLEIFVESLLKKASQVTRARNARTLTPAHLKASINSEQQFSFLREMVAAVPDINTSVDEEPLSASTEQTVQANVPYVRHNSTRRSNSRPGTNARSSSTGSRGRQRKFGGRDAPDRSISMCDDEDDADETDEDRDADDVEENDEDETSSCDNSMPPAACPVGGQSLSVTESTPAPTPLIRSVAHVIDDDYDAV